MEEFHPVGAGEEGKGGEDACVAPVMGVGTHPGDEEGSRIRGMIKQSRPHSHQRKR